MFDFLQQVLLLLLAPPGTHHLAWVMPTDSLLCTFSYCPSCHSVCFFHDDHGPPHTMRQLWDQIQQCDPNG
ncbi:hypothetical protein B0T09DRAFT_336600 [Sordaria sp. MPI-SDFR-AT-0083]|nr:hypothetical protein B0T09DRAFT_336600 [Sordaria sp. MPI-SDFR-AT-0083]